MAGIVNGVPLSPAESPDFWRDTQPYVAVNPQKPEDAAGLAEFAVSQEATRSLLYFQTSGSEGVPKWVGISRSAFLHSARAVNAHLEVKVQDRWLIALPLHHVGGFSILARCHEAGSSFVRTNEKWDARRFADLCRAEHITLASLVPTQVYDLVTAGVEAPSCLRAIVVGGGALPTAENVGLRAVGLGWPILQSYGMTEACSQIATEPLDHLYAGFDPESLEVLRHWDLTTDEEDVLTLRGPALASGYAVKRENGWEWEPLHPELGLKTRDRVQLWQHGTRHFLRFLGRQSSFVKVLGELVNLAELQSRLDHCGSGLGFPLGKSAIVALPDARRDTRLVLAGEGSWDLLEALRVQFNATCAGYERLESALVVPTLPRTSLGKLDLPQLKSMIAGP